MLNCVVVGNLSSTLLYYVDINDTSKVNLYENYIQVWCFMSRKTTCKLEMIFILKDLWEKKQVHHRKNSTTTIALINQNGIFINNQTNNYLI